MDDVVQKARWFACNKHAGHKRKYDGKLYTTHLESGVSILAAHNYTNPLVVAAALLHDTLEDTDTTLPELQVEFGFEVAELVHWLSDLEKGTRDTRKMMSALRLSRAPFPAKLIKLA